MKYFSSDWHIDHKNIIKYASRPFSSIEEMNIVLIGNMFKRLKKGDEFFFLGDMSFSTIGYDKVLSKIPKGVAFHWILGNHDKYKTGDNRVASMSYMKEIKIQGNPVTLCHYPMLSWNKSAHNSWMLYGHHHKGENNIKRIDNKISGKMLNVNCEFHDFLPLSERDITTYMYSCPDNITKI